MEFNKTYQQFAEALSDQPIFVHDTITGAGHEKWQQIKNAKLLSNETIEIYLEDGTTTVMNLRAPNPKYRIMLNDGTMSDALTIAGIYSLLQPSVVVNETTLTQHEKDAINAYIKNANEFGDDTTSFQDILTSIEDLREIGFAPARIKQIVNEEDKQHESPFLGSNVRDKGSLFKYQKWNYTPKGFVRIDLRSWRTIGGGSYIERIGDRFRILHKGEVTKSTKDFNEAIKIALNLARGVDGQPIPDYD